MTSNRFQIGSLGWVSAVIALLFLASPAAEAATIDFNSLPTGQCLPSGTSFTTQGFSFSTASAGGFFSCDGARTDLPSNGTVTVGSENPTVTTMTKQGGGSFSVSSIDLGELFTSTQGPFQVQLTGNLTAGGTVSVSLDLDGINDGAGGAADFQTFLLSSGFSALDSLVLTGILPQEDPRFMFDNIVVDAAAPGPQVPAPPALILLGLGLTGLALRRRVR